ncbi:hypothetical protein DSO57_1010114 [Entomophthora muscae]|uniref:Uncharacterized protein n=1 Tax=Entomophthora muscae TaxID=34485 RepID=A0ACC2U4R1_9FUNG|nr:hypothetical protein DSO57_1010114 [Entomophthora muscae]
MYAFNLIFLGFLILSSVQASCSQEIIAPYNPNQVFLPEMNDIKARHSCTLTVTPIRRFKTIHNQCLPASEQGKCTEWADGRFYQITGQHIEFNGSAMSWPDQARRNPRRWIVSETPTAPSVAIFQPGIDGAGIGGHSAIVEYRFAAGDLCTTNWNAPTAARLSLLRVRHKPGMVYITLRR